MHHKFCYYYNLVQNFAIVESTSLFVQSSFSSIGGDVKVKLSAAMFHLIPNVLVEVPSDKSNQLTGRSESGGKSRRLLGSFELHFLSSKTAEFIADISSFIDFFDSSIVCPARISSTYKFCFMISAPIGYTPLTSSDSCNSVL